MKIQRSLAASATSALLLLVLTALVATSATHALDVAVRDTFRPGDVWGSTQLAGGALSELLGPPTSITVLIAIACGAAWRRRSWHPLRYAALAASCGGSLTVLIKLALARTDPHQDLSSIGSFPSGHMAALIVCLGAAVLLGPVGLRGRLMLIVAGLATLMALALLVQATHWFTDVVGGALVGVVVLGATALTACGSPPGTVAAAHTGSPTRTR